RNDLPHSVEKQIQREVAEVTISLRKPSQVVREHLQLAGHAHPQNQLLAPVCELTKWGAQPRKALVRLGHRTLVRRADEQAVDTNQELVARRPFDWPLGQPFV